MDRSARKREYEARLLDLFAKGMRGTMSRLFRQYVAEFSEPDAKFDELYLAGLFTTGTPPAPLRRRDRFRILVRQFERTLALEGRVAECGCFRGLSSFLLCSCLRQHDRLFDGTGYEIYDSFCGLSDPQPEDVPTAESDELVVSSLRARNFAFPLQEVQRALADFPGIGYGAGWIPEAFPNDKRRYRFVHVDVDLYQPTKASLEYFWSRLVPGGLMVCDDYNWEGAKRAVEEFSSASAGAFSVTASNQAVFQKA